MKSWKKNSWRKYPAYYSALKKGYDIDKPRNLAKSVTVE